MSVDPITNPGLCRDIAFFLDVDGTLVEIAETPGQISVSTSLVTLVRDLVHVNAGAVALVSGRTIENIDQLFAPLTLPISGVHGLERRDAQGYEHRTDLTVPQHARKQLSQFVDAHDGLILEHKTVAVAVHFRRAPRWGQLAVRHVRDLATELGPKFDVQLGKAVVELRPGGRNKGSAIDDFMSEAPFAGRVPVFVGDDYTDEDGFKVVNDRCGYSIRVGDDRETSASNSLPDVRSVRHWLGCWIAAAAQRDS